MSCSSSSYVPQKRNRNEDNNGGPVILTERQKLYARFTDLIENKIDDVKKIYDVLKNNPTMLDLLYFFEEVFRNKDKYAMTLQNLYNIVKYNRTNQKLSPNNIIIDWSYDISDYNRFIMKLVLFHHVVSQITIWQFKIPNNSDDLFYYFEMCKNLKHLHVDSFNDFNYFKFVTIINLLNNFKNTLEVLFFGECYMNLNIRQETIVDDNYPKDILNLDFFRNNRTLEDMYVCISDWNFVRRIYADIFNEISHSENNIKYLDLKFSFWSFADTNSVYGERNNNIECFESIMYLIETLSKEKQLRSFYLCIDEITTIKASQYPFFTRLFESLAQPGTVISKLQFDVNYLFQEKFFSVSNIYFKFFAECAANLKSFILKLNQQARLTDEEKWLLIDLLHAIENNKSISQLSLLKNFKLKTKRAYDLSRSDYCRFFIDKDIHDSLMRILKRKNLTKFNILDGSSNTIGNQTTYNQITRAISTNNSLVLFTTYKDYMSFPYSDGMLKEVTDNSMVSFRIPNYVDRLAYINQLVCNNVQSKKNKKTNLFNLLWNQCFDTNLKRYKKKIEFSGGSADKKQRIN